MREAAAVRRTPSLSRSVKRCKLVDTQRRPSRRRPPPVLFSSNFSETVKLVQRNDSESQLVSGGIDSSRLFRETRPFSKDVRH